MSFTGFPKTYEIFKARTVEGLYLAVSMAFMACRLTWSYSLPSKDQIDDDTLIEKSLLDLDNDDINLLFKIFPRERIKKVWEDNILVLEPYYHNMNIFFGWFYFDIDDIDKHQEKILKLKRHAGIA